MWQFVQGLWKEMLVNSSFGEEMNNSDIIGLEKKSKVKWR